MSARFRGLLRDGIEAALLRIAFAIAALLWPARDLAEGE
jgi:hypothetical protein